MYTAAGFCLISHCNRQQVSCSSKLSGSRFYVETTLHPATGFVFIKTVPGTGFMSIPSAPGSRNSTQHPATGFVPAVGISRSWNSPNRCLFSSTCLLPSMELGTGLGIPRIPVTSHFGDFPRNSQRHTSYEPIRFRGCFARTETHRDWWICTFFATTATLWPDLWLPFWIFDSRIWKRDRNMKIGLEYHVFIFEYVFHIYECINLIFECS